MKMAYRADSSHGIGVENQHHATNGRNSLLVRIRCPYNPSHLYPKSNHAFHLMHCPDRVDKLFSEITVLDNSQADGPVLKKLSSMPVVMLDEASCVGYKGRPPPPFAVIERPKMSEDDKRKQELLLRTSSGSSASTQPKNISENYPLVALKPSLTIPYGLDITKDEKMTQKLPSSSSKKVDSTLYETRPQWNLQNVSKGVNPQAIQNIGLEQGKPRRIAANIFGDIDRAVTEMNPSGCSNSIKDMNNCHLNPKQPVHQNPRSFHYDFFPVQNCARAVLPVTDRTPSSCSNKNKFPTQLCFTPLEPLIRIREQNEALLYKQGYGRGVLHVPEVKPSSFSNSVNDMNNYHLNPNQPIGQNPGSFHYGFPVQNCVRAVLPVTDRTPSSCSNKNKFPTQLGFTPLEPLIQIRRFKEDVLFKQGYGRGVLHVPEVKPSSCSDSVKDTNDNIKDTNDNIKDANDNIKDTNDNIKDTNDPFIFHTDYPFVSSKRVPVRDMKPSSSSSSVKDTNNSIKDSNGSIKDTNNSIKDTNDSIKDTNDCHFSPKQPVHQNTESFDDYDYTVLDCER